MKPLYDKIYGYNKENVLHFHTPLTTKKINNEIYGSSNFDITELSFSDNLQCPNGVIKDAEILLSKKYKTLATQILTSGATTGLFIALNIAKELKGKILIAPCGHKSIFSGKKLFDLNFVEMEQKFLDNGLPKVLDAKSLENALKNDNSIKAVVITSPNYFGQVIDFKKIQEVVKKYKVLTIIDEAHGAHFAYSNLLPESLANKFDLVIDSVHKTLPVYTGGALLHINNNKLVEKANMYRSLIHTTSPNYLTMASIDFSREYFELNGEKIYKELFEKIQILNLKLEKFKIVKNDDFSRLVLNVSPFCGEYVQNLLEKKNVFVEMNYKNFIVFITSPLEIQNIEKAIEILNTLQLDYGKIEKYNNFIISNNKIYETKNLDYEFIDIKNSENRISKLDLGIYPPGTVVVKSGQMIDKNTKNFLIKNKLKLFGLVSGKICVIV